MSVVVRYSLLRLGLLALALLVLGLVGFQGWLLLVLAAVVSMALSFVLLSGPREAMTQAIVERRARPRRRRRTRSDDDADAEDAQAYGDVAADGRGGTPGDDVSGPTRP